MTEPGAATDAAGNAVLDPTKNVLDLVQAAIARQDDLRIAEAQHVREVIALRAEMATLRASHAKEVLEGEAARLDAIRAVDVQAVQQKALEAETRATALANQVTAAAEAMRNQVAAAATAAATALAAALEPVQKDIADLRRAQYEAQGRSVERVDTRASSGAVAGYVVGAVGILVSLVTLVVLFTSSGGATP